MKPSHLLSAFLLVAPATALILGTPAVAQADAKGNAVLEKVDEQGNAFTDQSYSAQMEIWKGGSKKKTLEFVMNMKGLDKQFITFTAPGDVAGMKVLMNGQDNLWLYNSEFKKVRRIAAHTQKQGMFGSEFTAEDMVMAKLATLFDAEISGKSGSKTTLKLTPKEGVTTSYSRIDVVIDSTKGGVTKLSYYDGSNNLTRVQTRSGWKKVEGKPMPTVITMENKKTGNKTVIKLSNVKVNQGLDEDTFSRRNLLRGT